MESNHMSIEDLKAKKAAEAQSLAVETSSPAAAKAQIEEMQAKLDREERKNGSSGAIPLATKQTLLDGSDVAKKMPDKRLRWVNVSIAEKVQLRQNQGYTRVPASEGGRQVGNLALFELPRDVYEERVKELQKRHQERLVAHKGEVEAEAEAVARVLRDKYGIRSNILYEE